MSPFLTKITITVSSPFEKLWACKYHQGVNIYGLSVACTTNKHNFLKVFIESCQNSLQEILVPLCYFSFNENGSSWN